MQVLYTAEATATGHGRDGRARSSDGVLDVELVTPKELGGAGGAATNPEQLFAAGYAACFHSALQFVARRAKVAVDGSSVTAQVDIGPVEGGHFGLGVTLSVELPGVDGDVAQQLVRRSHQVCPYSNATRGNIDVAIQVNGITIEAAQTA